MPTQMHLLGFLIHGPINHTILSWADARDERVAGLSSIRYWQDLARLLKRGCFDGVFFADLPGGRRSLPRAGRRGDPLRCVLADP